MPLRDGRGSGRGWRGRGSTYTRIDYYIMLSAVLVISCVYNNGMSFTNKDLVYRQTIPTGLTVCGKCALGILLRTVSLNHST